MLLISRGSKLKRSKTTMYATRVLAVVAMSVLFATAPAVAQNEAIGKQSPKESGSLEIGNKSRARRAVSDALDEKSPEKDPKDSTESPAAKAPGDGESAQDPALMALRDEIDAAPDAQERARLQLKLVDHLVLAGRKQEAVAELHSMTAEDRFDPQGFYNVANALARLGELDGAVNGYRKAIDQRKGRYSRAFNNLGVVLMRLGRWEDAYEAFTTALRLEGFRYAEASYNLGHLYAVRGERDLAVREWRRAVLVDPDHTEAARVLAASGRVGNIIVVVEAPAATPASLSSPARSSRGLARPLEIAKPKATGAETKSPRAEPPSSRSSRTMSVDPVTYRLIQRARNSLERGRNLEAVENYRRVIDRMEGYFAPANLELSYALFALKRNDEAFATLLSVTQRDGASFPISFYHVARLYELRGDLPLAEENYARASEYFPENNSQFLLDISRVREKLGNLSGALSAMEQYISNMQRQGQKPEWSEGRLAVLRQKVAAAQNPARP